MKMHLTPEDKLLLSVVKLYPSTEELEYMNALIPQITDWEVFTKSIIAHGSAPLLFKKLCLLGNAQLIPVDVITKLQQAYYKTLTRSMVLYEGFIKVVGAFTAADIQVVSLKGVYLSECLYGDIALRQFSDIDMLVREEDGEKCLEILSGMGFIPYTTNMTEFIDSQAEIVHYKPMVKGDISVEVHIRLHRKSKQYNIKTARFINNAIPVTINKTEVYALQLYDLLIYLCVHLDKHFGGGYVQMKCFNDIVNLLSINEKVIDWQLFIDACRLHECEELVFKYLVMVNRFYQVPLPQNILTSYSNLLKIADVERFMYYLHDVEIKKYHVTTHLENMSGTKSLSDKLRYFIELAFPPKKFMIEKYGNKFIIYNLQFIITKRNKIRLPWWMLYPYRWGVGVKGVIQLIRTPNPSR